MCSLVDEQYESALRVIYNEDIELAHRVIELDHKVDRYDLKIADSCQKIFALNKPVSSDLRLLMSAPMINNNLERIGDIAVNLCENFLLKKKKPEFFDRIKFIDMAHIVQEMLRNSIDSFIRMDVGLAKTVIVADKILDKLNVENHNLIVELMKEDKENIQDAVAYLVMCRQLERIGDHATNIAEDVFFIVSGRTVRHKYGEFFNEKTVELPSDKAGDQ
jgi:phosphate transport system protein